MTEQEMQELFPLIDRLTQTAHKIDKENQRLRKALEAIKELENGKSYNTENDFWKAVETAREALEESE